MTHVLHLVASVDELLLDTFCALLLFFFLLKLLLLLSIKTVFTLFECVHFRGLTFDISSFIVDELLLAILMMLLLRIMLDILNSFRALGTMGRVS